MFFDKAIIYDTWFSLVKSCNLLSQRAGASLAELNNDSCKLRGIIILVYYLRTNFACISGRIKERTKGMS